jgi:serine/threonine-protein kinase HSL1 (negative regulator of Swe1 kinase)
VHSYDPYKSSRIMGDNEASHAKITVHRNGSLARNSTLNTNMQRMKSESIKSNSTYSRRGVRSRHIAVPAGMRCSRRSLTSTRSGEGTPYKRPTPRRKRGIDFSHVRKHSLRKQPPRANRGPASIARDDTTYVRDLMSPTSPNKRPIVSRCQEGGARPRTRARAGTQSMMNVSKAKDTQFLWNDELRQISYSIAKDCDEAFNSSLLTADSHLGESTFDPSTIDSSMMDLQHDAKSLSMCMITPTPANHPANGAKRDSRLWDTRPLPPAPPTTDSVLHEIMLAKKRTAQRVGKSDESQGHVDRMMTHLDTLAPSADARKREEERRASSAPIYSQYSTQWGKDTIPLPSIFEGQQEMSFGGQDKYRAVSAPTGETPLGQSTPRTFADSRGLEYLARHENTIRVVMSPSNQRSPVKAPAPLNVRKKLARGATAHPQTRQELNLRQEYAKGAIREAVTEKPSTPLPQSASGPTRKKSSWFKRASKDKNDVFTSKGGSSSSHMEEISYTDSNTSTAPPIPPTKKKSFNFAFWRNNKDQNQMKLSLAGKIITTHSKLSNILGTVELTQSTDIDLDDSPSPEPVRMFSHPARPPHNGQWKDNVSTRNIEPQQNWLARLFRVKPATEHLCFAIPRRRARQEIAILLREWRRYGIRDVQVDKDRNLVFGRVGHKNCM